MFNSGPLNTLPLNADTSATGNVFASSADATDTLALQVALTFVNEAGAENTLTLQLGAVLTDAVDATDSLTGSKVFATRSFADETGAEDGLALQLQMVLANEAGAENTLTALVGQAVLLIDEAGAESTFAGKSQAILPVLASEAGAADALAFSAWMTLADEAGAESTFTGKSQVLLPVLVNEAGAESTLSLTLAQYLTLVNEAGAADALAVSSNLTISLLNEAGALDVMDFGGRAELWVINTTTGGVSRYTGLGDVSLAALAGRLLLASSAGLFELLGANDNGTPISASLTTGLMDFGSHLLKRVDSVNIGHETDGVLEIESTVTHGGTASTAVNTWPSLTAQVPRDGVCKIGKGMKSRYWQFIIRNKAGANFTLDNVDFHPVITTRRR